MFKFEKLEIWQDAIKFAEETRQLTKTFPKEERFNLVDQTNRAADSIATNIAEGSGSSTIDDFKRYLDIARKSVYETVSHLHKARIRNYLTEETRKKFYEKAEILVKRINKFKEWLSQNKRF